jgi:thioredoxin-related protein
MNTRMKIILGLVFAGLLAAAGVTISKSNKDNEETAVKQEKSNSQFANYTTALAKAKAENKMLLVDVFTDWCVWCKRMDKDVYTDPAVQAEMNKYFTSVKLDAEAKDEHNFRGKATSEEAIAQNMKVTGYPTTVFMTADEQVIQAIPGYIKAPDFVMVLRYIGTKAYEKAPFDEWKKTQS